MTDPITFTCPECHMTSHNPNDARAGYCGNCNAYTGPDLERGSDKPRGSDLPDTWLRDTVGTLLAGGDVPGLTDVRYGVRGPSGRVFASSDQSPDVSERVARELAKGSGMALVRRQGDGPWVTEVPSTTTHYLIPDPDPRNTRHGYRSACGIDSGSSTDNVDEVDCPVCVDDPRYQAACAERSDIEIAEDEVRGE